MTTADEFDEQVARLDDLVDRFGAMTANAEALAADPPDALESLFPDAFMAQHTAHDSFRAFLAASPWRIESQSDFDDIPEADFDTYVERETVFPTWDAMLDTASRQWFFTQVQD